ncbi:MAG: hypothetical protein ACR2JE_08660 [Acidobacteriaceae bacterium]
MSEKRIDQFTPKQSKSKPAPKAGHRAKPPAAKRPAKDKSS